MADFSHVSWGHGVGRKNRATQVRGPQVIRAQYLLLGFAVRRESLWLFCNDSSTKIQDYSPALNKAFIKASRSHFLPLLALCCYHHHLRHEDMQWLQKVLNYKSIKLVKTVFVSHQTAIANIYIRRSVSFKLLAAP